MSGRRRWPMRRCRGRRPRRPAESTSVPAHLPLGVPSIPVTHATGSYDVHVAPGLIAEAAGRIAALLPGRRLALVTDPDIRGALTSNGLWPAIDATVIEVPPGERAKSREEWSGVTDRLLALGLGRDSALVALGGGSVGDLTGFVASTYLRG